MIILAVDPAKSCGYAFHNDQRSLSAIRAGVIKAEGESFEDRSATLARKFITLIREERPDLIVIEMPIRTSPAARRKVKFMGEEEEVGGGVSGLNAIISSNQIVGAIAAVAGIKGIPFLTMATVSWRRAFMGADVMKQARAEKWGRKEWKRAVREQCAREKIVVTNDDMADAAALSVAAKTTDTYRMMKHRAQEQAA